LPWQLRVYTYAESLQKIRDVATLHEIMAIVPTYHNNFIILCQQKYLVAIISACPYENVERGNSCYLLWWILPT
jgi:hypothetical protein